jgi:hypothetical protein
MRQKRRHAKRFVANEALDMPALHLTQDNEFSSRRQLLIGAAEIAFPEMIGNLIERALLPLLGLRQPEHPALGIQRGTLPAHIFLTAYFREPVHEPHSCV